MSVSGPDYVRRHLAIGWWALLLFASLGLTLEAMHGFKVGWYLAVENETRRLMWRLAHAHGNLLALVHMAFAGTAHLLGPERAAALRLPSALLSAATILMPAGFFLGGLRVYGGDPSLGVLLVPPGALALLVALALTARAVQRRL